MFFSKKSREVPKLEIQNELEHLKAENELLKNHFVVFARRDACCHR